MTCLRVAAGALALALLVPGAAAAQQQRNPFADLFGRAPQRSGREFTAVQFRSTAGAQWGQTLQDEFTPPDATIPEGLSGGADASVTADYVHDRVQFAAQGRYNYQEYRQDPPFGAPGFDAGFRGEVKATTRLLVHGGAHYTRSPFYQLIWLPLDAVDLPPADRSAILMLRTDSTEGNVGLTSNYTKRSSIDINADMRRTSFAALPMNDFSSVSGRVRWKRQMSRDVAVHAGYGREQMRQQFVEGPRDFRNELLDIGIDYSRGFSFARRTTFSFTTETSMVRENDGPRQFRINGSALFERRFARTWVAQLAARRATEFHPGFRAPVFTESGSAVLAGYLSKRLLLSLNADGGQGQAGLSDPRKYVSYSGSGKVTFAMNRHFGVFTQYVYYHYQTPADPLTLFLLPQGARQAVSIGLQTWIPLIDKEKVPSDSR